MIVVGVDGSAPSLEALRWAAKQAVLTRQDLTVVAAWEWPTSLGWMPPFPSDFDPAANAEKVLAGAIESVAPEFLDLKFWRVTLTCRRQECCLNLSM